MYGKEKIEQKLENINKILSEKNFLEKKGLGNEVSYYIFDYSPKDELVVRKYLKQIKENKKLINGEYEIVVYDVYDIMIELLKEEGYLEDCINMEKEEGMDYLIEAVNSLLRMSDDNNYFSEYLEKNTKEKSIVFLCGVGKIFPFVRSHKILNNLHQYYEKCPVVMFYPGKYDGQTLKLFGEFLDDNYYRAFPLIR